MEFYRLQVLEGNIKIYIKDIGWEPVGWMYLARDGLSVGGGCCEHGNEYSSFKRC